jgi:GNAT superfamily N-acetyltransferase
MPPDTWWSAARGRCGRGKNLEAVVSHAAAWKLDADLPGRLGDETVQLIAPFWFRILAKARIYRRLILAERPLGEPQPEFTTSLSMSVELLREDQVDAYLALRPNESGAEVRRRLAAGQWCFANWLDRQIIGAAWMTGGRAHLAYLDRDLDLVPDEVYIYDGYTSPAFRGSRASPLRTARAIRHASGLGYRRVLATFLPENRPALPLWNRVGYRPIGMVGYVKLGPWRLDFLRMRPGSPPREARGSCPARLHDPPICRSSNPPSSSSPST